jgi:alpha-L-arabinofuranosidase
MKTSDQSIILAAIILAASLTAVGAQTTTVTVETAAPGKAISPDLFGIFFEDLSCAADGGLYTELVQNRSFEYSAADRPEWNALTSWELVQREGGQGMVVVDSAQPLHPNNPHYAVLGVANGGGGVGLQNSGFDSIVVKAGEHYDVSLFARQLAYPEGPLTVRLESKSGELLGEAKLPTLTGGWKKYTATLEAAESAEDARLVVLAFHPGRIGLDMISLFPQKTFHNRPNGLRADLAQVIADLKPGFMRFPGGCLVHGDGLDNLYHWKNTIGPVEQRKGQRNIWRYHQSVGLGYFEYFQFCEDIGAKPLPVVPAGVSCQNSGASVTKRWEQGQRGLPIDEMPGYVQDVLDLIEWANGPEASTWGAKRAAAGHPEPFHLKYLGVGNEDKITPVFKERFQMIYEAVKAKHPEITVIGTVGPRPDDDDYTNGWRFADELRLPMVDEHYYKPPQWFWDNLHRYDLYDRSKSKVYAGEYAAHDDRRRTTLRSALAEAAHLTSLERNGDVVVMASYAPLLAKRGHTHWNPDLIYFSNTEIVPTISYYVQQLFSLNNGDRCLTTTVNDPANARDFAVSSVRNSTTGDVILKLVNGAVAPKPLRVEMRGAERFASNAMKTVLAGDDPMAVNDFARPQTVLPQTSTLAIGPAFDYEAPANSLTVIRISRR